MKKRKLVFKNIALLAFISLGFIACERDFAEIGTGIVGDDNFSTANKTYPVITYNKRVTPIQSNALPDNLLGYYKDPNFSEMGNANSGTTTANFVSQLTPKRLNPTFGDNIVLDSVILTIPYYGKAVDFDTNNLPIYELDSVYPKNNFSPMDISIYRSNYFLRDFDPTEDFDVSQKYFSNGATSENDVISSSDLEGDLIYKIDNFIPDENLIILTKPSENEGEDDIETGRLVPSFRFNLIENLSNIEGVDENFWQDLIFAKEGEVELSNLNNFYDYFRGIYFKIEDDDGFGTLMQLDFSDPDKSSLVLYYTSDVTYTVNDEEETNQIQGEYEMTFSGNRVNIFNNNFSSSVLQTIANANETEGDERLYLKGGEGSMAIIDLFTEDEQGNTFDDYMNEFREVDEEGDIIDVKRLINEAFLEFYIDDLISDGSQPNRIYLYDLKNNQPIIDYFLDQSTSSTSNDGKSFHLAPLEIIEDELTGEVLAKKYKVRVTEHINNMILNDSTNVKLGLVVSSNVGAVTNYNVLTEEENFTKFPSGAILSPKSTILHGNKSSDEDKKVKLKIYYTEPNN